MPSPLTSPPCYGRQSPPIGAPARPGTALATGLSFAPIFGGGGAVDAVSRSAGVWVGSGSAVVATPFGPGVLLGSSPPSGIKFPGAMAQGANALSVAFWMHASGTTQYTTPFEGSSNGTIRIGGQTNNGEIDCTGSSGGGSSAASIVIVGTWHHYALTWASNVNGGVPLWYRDGRPFGGLTNPVYTWSAGPVVGLGDWVETWHGQSALTLAAFAMWNRTLLPGEVRRLYLAPFCCF